MHYVIGDIHANIRELEKLLQHIQPRREDTLIFLGDYIDCLPHTRETIDRLNALAETCTCVFLKGNHEFLWDQYLNSGDLQRQDYLLQYGGLDALEHYGSSAIEALKNNDLPVLREVLQPYLHLMTQTKDWHYAGEYLALHAGLLAHQYTEDPLVFSEENYFIRSIPTDRKYLDTYTLIVGHTYLSDEPTFEEGYINIDLGARQGRFIGAFNVEESSVIRSDGTVFPLQ